MYEDTVVKFFMFIYTVLICPLSSRLKSHGTRCYFAEKKPLWECPNDVLYLNVTDEQDRAM